MYLFLHYKYQSYSVQTWHFNIMLKFKTSAHYHNFSALTKYTHKPQTLQQTKYLCPFSVQQSDDTLGEIGNTLLIWVLYSLLLCDLKTLHERSLQDASSNIHVKILVHFNKI